MKKIAEKQILEWIHSKDFNSFGQYLVSGSVHGKPGIPVGELSRLGKILRKNFSAQELYPIGKELLKRSEYTARRLGLSIVADSWPHHKDIENIILTAADDDDWMVRETAAGVFARLLNKDFSHFSKLFLKWIESKSDNTKRAIALAVKYDASEGDAKKWATYFKLIDPLMSEEAEYIRKNLGPFAIGDGLLAKYPEQVLKACQTWAKSKNENVRWNTAMIFTAAAAAKVKKESKSILRLLAKDESKFVAQAAKKALKKI